MKATLSRGGESVDVPLVEDTSGAPIAIRGVGKPNLQIKNTGSVNPRFSDIFSGLDQYTLVGRFVGSAAYEDALTLADFMKENPPEGEPLILNIDSDEFDTDITVVPGAGQEGALTLGYEPGTKDVVIADISLTRVSNITGTIDQDATTPRASGDGPIQISKGGTTVDLELDVTVDRSIGRPEDVTRRGVQEDPFQIVKTKSAYDEFELSVTYTQDAVSIINDLVDLFRPQLQNDPLTLDFNGLYGMGSMNVVPVGSEAIRFIRTSGTRGVSIIPSMTLRRVL